MLLTGSYTLTLFGVPMTLPLAASVTDIQTIFQTSLSAYFASQIVLVDSVVRTTSNYTYTATFPISSGDVADMALALVSGFAGAGRVTSSTTLQTGTYVKMAGTFQLTLLEFVTPPLAFNDTSATIRSSLLNSIPLILSVDVTEDRADVMYNGMDNASVV